MRITILGILNIEFIVKFGNLFSTKYLLIKISKIAIRKSTPKTEENKTYEINQLIDIS